MLIDFITLFLLLAGFTIGLGAVTVIDLHGFLARKSSYWTEATIRTHKVTKPMIWVGISLACLGGVGLFRNEALSGVPFYLLLIAITLVLNGLFLSFSVSPYLLEREKEGMSSQVLPQDWQKKITVSFIVSVLGWWGALGLVVYHLVQR